MAYHGLLLYVRQDVGVEVQGDGDGRVPEHLLDDLRVYVLRQQDRGTGVPKIVETLVGQPCLPEQGLPKLFAEVRGGKRGVVAGREHPLRAVVLPLCSRSLARANPESFMVLLLFLVFGGETTPSKTVLFTLRMPFWRSMSPHLSPRSSPYRMPVVTAST